MSEHAGMFHLSMCFYCGSDLEETLEEILVLVRSSSKLQQNPKAELALCPCSSLGAAAALSSSVTCIFMVSRTRSSAPGLWSLLGCGDHIPSLVAFSKLVLMDVNLTLVSVLALVQVPVLVLLMSFMPSMFLCA